MHIENGDISVTAKYTIVVSSKSSYQNDEIVIGKMMDIRSYSQPRQHVVYKLYTTTKVHVIDYIAYGLFF